MSKNVRYILKMDPVEKIIYRSILRNNSIGIRFLRTEAKRNA